jgi:hypothetical protein
MTVYHWELQRPRSAGDLTLWGYAGQAGAESSRLKPAEFAAARLEWARPLFSRDGGPLRVVVWDVPGAGADPVAIAEHPFKEESER